MGSSCVTCRSAAQSSLPDDLQLTTFTGDEPRGVVAIQSLKTCVSHYHVGQSGPIDLWSANGGTSPKSVLSEGSRTPRDSAAFTSQEACKDISGLISSLRSGVGMTRGEVGQLALIQQLLAPYIDSLGKQSECPLPDDLVYPVLSNPNGKDLIDPFHSARRALSGAQQRVASESLNGGPPNGGYLGSTGTLACVPTSPTTTDGGVAKVRTFSEQFTPMPSILAGRHFHSDGETDSAVTAFATPLSDPRYVRLLEESKRAIKKRFLLLRCWSTVVDRESTGLEISFVELLHRAGARMIGSERLDLFSSLVARRGLFMDMMTKLFEIGLDNMESVYMLHQLGVRHIAYGLTRQDYEAYTGPFVRTVAACSLPNTCSSVVRNLLRQFWQQATTIMLDGAAETQGLLSLKEAPKGAPFAVIFTDVEASTNLWETQPVAMEKAVDEHHKLIRHLIEEHHGYEVKTIGDSFMIAFKNLADAVIMALRLQVELMRIPIEGLVVDGSQLEATGPDLLWNPSSLRVRTGVHWCTDATPKFDVVYKRYDFYGNDVNVASRVQDAGCGGQTLCSGSTMKAIQALPSSVRTAAFVRPHAFTERSKQRNKT